MIHQPGFKSKYNSNCTPPRCGRVGLKKLGASCSTQLVCPLCELWSENQFESRRDPTRADEAQTSASTTDTASRPRQAAQPTKAGSPDFCLCNSHLHLAGVLLAGQLLRQPASSVHCTMMPSTVTRRIVTIMISAPLFKITRILQPYCMILLCCSLLLQYLYYQDLLLICTGRNPTVLLHRYCRSIATTVVPVLPGSTTDLYRQESYCTIIPVLQIYSSDSCISAYERPTGYIKYESLVCMTLNPT